MKNYGELRLGALAGVVWTGGGQAFRNVMALATSVALARLLSPDDFGVFALSVMAVEFAQLFANAGFGASLVQQQQADKTALSTLFWINAGLGAVCALLMAAAALPAANWFHQPLLAPVLICAGLGVVISSAMVVPSALLNIDLRFRDITMAQTIGSLSGAVCAISLALAGTGVWALVAQPLVGSSVTLFEMFRRSGWLPRMIYQWQSVKSLMAFSGQLLGSNFFSFLNRSAWAAVIGRSLGTEQVGLFNLGQQIMFAPIAQFSSVLTRVLFPTLSKLRDSPQQYARVWLRAVGTVGFVTFPILGGLMATLPDFVPVILGKQWMGVIPVVQLLCPVAMVQSVSTLSGSVLMSGGHGRAMMTASIASLVVMLGGLLVGLEFGLRGVTIGFAVGALFSHLLTIVIAVRVSGIGLPAFISELTPTVLCTAGMSGSILLVAMTASTLSAPLRLSLCVGVGTLAYLGISWLLNRGPIDFVLTSVRELRSG